MNKERDNLIWRYWLGELSEKEQTDLEERLMTDDQFFDEVLIVEDEISAAYERGELDAEERARFEQTILQTPQGREHLNFNIAFRQYVADAQRTAAITPAPQPLSPAPSLWQALVAFWQAQKPVAMVSLTAIVLLIALCAWLALRVARLQGQFEAMQDQQIALQIQTQESERELAEERAKTERLANDVQAAQAESAALKEQLAAVKSGEKKIDDTEPPGSGLLAQLTLSPGEVRSGNDLKEAALTPEKRTLQLRLRVAQDIYRNFRAQVVRRNSSDSPLTYTPVKVEKRADEVQVILQLPAARLVSGEYVIILTGTTADGKTESVGRYPFKVTKPPA